MNKALQAKIENDPALRAATEWFLELRSSEVSVERIGEWQKWLTEDAAHASAFERIESFWNTGQQAVTTHWPTDAQVKADAYDGNVSISQWRTRQQPTSRRLRYALAASVAAAVVAVGWFAVSQWIRPTIRTIVGETRTLTLPDGSTVAVGAATLLATRFADDARHIELKQGEAFFRVEKDTARPFTVRAGDTSITAIGTAFDVRRAGERVVIAVAEGAVLVQRPGQRPEQLGAGQQLNVEPESAVQQIAPVDSGSVAGWRQGRLQYLNEPLADVVSDLSRYSKRDIRIADEKVKDLRVTGIVFENNIDGWLASLEATFPVRVSQDTEGHIAVSGR